MRVTVLMCVLMLCGCKKDPSSASLPQPQLHRTVWDEVLAKPEYSNEVVLAGLDLPTDQWTNVIFGRGTNSFRINACKWHRIAALTDKALREVKPTLKGMTASNLVYCFRLANYSGPPAPDYGEVAEYVFWNGNFLIKRELESKSLDELQVLRTFRNDKVTIIEHSQSMPSSLPWQLDEIIADVREGHTVLPRDGSTNK